MTGNAYIDACGEHDDDWDDLKDFIVVKKGRDYSKALSKGGFLEAAGGAPKRAARQDGGEEVEEPSDEDPEVDANER